MKKQSAPAVEPALSRGLRRYLYFTAATTGAAIMVVEILGAKMLSPYVGLSHFVWTAQIAVTLVALAAVGAFVVIEKLSAWLRPRLALSAWRIAVALVLLASGSAVALAVSAYCKEVKVPFIVTTAQSADITYGKGHRYVFRTTGNNDISTRTVAYAAAKAWGSVSTARRASLKA